MKKYYLPPREIWETLYSRPSGSSEEISASVRQIIDDVRSYGDKALIDYSLKFDGVVPDNLKVSSDEIENACREVPQSLRRSIETAKQNIGKFHAAIMESGSTVITSVGVKCWNKRVPVEKVGLYIPGGSAPLFSTVLMLGIPARLAGCNEIIICTPAGRDGKVNPVILFTASLLGLDNIYKAGGAQAIAAMAFGTETIPKVFKIFGPGNRYVTKAKEIVQQNGTAIDMPAGPSEVLVIADGEADPCFVAADLLSQAEHGADSQAILLTDSEELIIKTEAEIKKQLNALPRKTIAEASLANSMAILLSSPGDCISFSNLYAPEHLIINTSNAKQLAGQVTNAGSVFIGRYSCESTGDYAAGPNHTLPTNGYARSYSGLSAESFMKQIFFQEATKEGIASLAPAVIEMAEAEHLRAHSNAIRIRL